MRIALLSAHAQVGDALGNQLAEKLCFFLERGAAVRVFLESDRRLHPVVRPHCQILTPQMLRGLTLPGSPAVFNDAWQFLSGADLVIADYSHYYALLELLPLLAGGRSRLVLDYHGVTPVQFWTDHNREALERGAGQRGLVWCADAALVHSRFAGHELLEPTRFPAERVGHIGYPVSSAAFGQGGVSRLRAELGLDQATIVLFVGRLAPNKRLPVLVEALAHLRDRLPAVHALMVGDGADVYENERHICRQRAAELGIADRLHFLGHVDDERLRDAYRSADLFVMPSRHEGFCIPVIEAMAAGVPVVAARAGALPETVGDAGLTFEPDDAADLARQMVRVLKSGGEELTTLSGDAPTPHPNPPPQGGREPNQRSQGGREPEGRGLRVAVVTCRYGDDFAGGAETSLRTMAEALHDAGHEVAVYTTTLRDLERPGKQHIEGLERPGGIAVHRFTPDPFDTAARAAAEQAIEQGAGLVSPEVERDYLTYSVRSHRLMASLRDRIDELDAVIVGPYLYGLAHDVATAFPHKTVLLPCFHDEPAARLAAFRAAYRQVGGILYHTPEEQAFAEIELGLNHPGAVCIGTFLDATETGAAPLGRETIGRGVRYLVYCGRYSPHKNLDLLFEHARRYAAERPDRFRFVFLGEGELAIPREPWARDLGFVTDSTRRDVMAGADALVQLSRNESLSLVALEAWAHGVPVVADSRCAVLAGQVSRSGAGWLVGCYEEFAAALDALWQDPQDSRERGARGRDYVRRQYGCRETYAARVADAIRGMAEPLAERMRRRGQARATQFDQTSWRQQFATLVEDWLQGPERSLREEVELQPRTRERTATAGVESALVPVRVVNRGAHALVPYGPAGVAIRCRVETEESGTNETLATEMPLPALLMPGRAVTVALAVPVPKAAGPYRVCLEVVRPQAACDRPLPLPERFGPTLPKEATLRLTVTGADAATGAAPIWEDVQAALLAAERLQRLPDEYRDVTHGWLAAWKRRLKEKLLNNFKRAYVDVLSRQQSAFNRQILSAVEELAEGFTALWAKVESSRLAPRDDAEGSRLAPLDESCSRSEQPTLKRIPS